MHRNVSDRRPVLRPPRCLAHTAGRGTIGGVTKRHPLIALVLALIPVAALVAGLPFVNRLQPVVLGLPFLLFWILGWVLVTPFFLAVAYVLVDTKGEHDAEGAGR
jgi:hypothetical protein